MISWDVEDKSLQCIWHASLHVLAVAWRWKKILNSILPETDHSVSLTSCLLGIAPLAVLDYKCAIRVNSLITGAIYVLVKWVRNAKRGKDSASVRSQEHWFHILSHSGCELGIAQIHVPKPLSKMLGIYHKFFQEESQVPVTNIISLIVKKYQIWTEKSICVHLYGCVCMC